MNLRAAPVIIAGFIALFSGAVHADTRQDVMEAMGKCAAIADDKGRLGCYDALAPQLRDALNIPPPVLTAPPTKEEEKSWFGFSLGALFGGQAQQTTPQQFGAETTPEAQQKTDDSEQEIDSISAGVTEYSYTLDKKFIVFLDNGQIWRQLQGDTDLAHFRRVPTDNKVTIERGAMGSYNLMINDSAEAFKAKRVK